MFLSAAMMLDWLGARHSDERLNEGARLLEDAVRTVFAERRVLPFEFGGRDGTREITEAVLNTLAHSRSP
jgi:3-isopropylmalate dehydrogenase